MTLLLPIPPPVPATPTVVGDTIIDPIPPVLGPTVVGVARPLGAAPTVVGVAPPATGIGASCARLLMRTRAPPAAGIGASCARLLVRLIGASCVTFLEILLVVLENLLGPPILQGTSCARLLARLLFVQNGPRQVLLENGLR